MNRRFYLILECAAAFYILPLMLYPFRKTLAFNVVPLLMVAGLAAVIYLRKSPTFDHQVWMTLGSLRVELRQISMVILCAGAIMAGYTWMVMPDHFLSFPRQKPLIWLIVMGLYPILAALPQEIIFRCFYFDRYQELFRGSHLMIALNAISFGMFHLFYGNWMAPILSGLGGALFAWRYHRSKSLPIVALEHGLWGNFLFTVGLGWYFYSGSI